jgi:hypothetical protein
MPRGGKREGAGRKPGVPNKDNSDIRAMIIGALNQVGGVDYLAARAVDTPAAFMTLVGKVLPLQLAGHDGQRLVVDFRWADAEPAPPTIEAVADETASVSDATIDAEAVDVADETTVTFIGEC